jgi:hypothetical protein
MKILKEEGGQALPRRTRVCLSESEKISAGALKLGFKLNI